MASSRTVYCTRCARQFLETMSYCSHCGQPRRMDARGRAGHLAFVLNELHEPPMTVVLDEAERAQLVEAYTAQLDQLVPRPAAAAAAPRVGFPARAAAPDATSPPPAPPPPARPARAPMDWTWLAEQQANLFLFAGAFLTVVAALIYVGYSGEAIADSLKMTLFTGYTLAFLAAGWTCLRYERVRIAGRVFFGVGAVLVPLNFAVARTFSSDADVSVESMWLAGSIVTAAFYFAIAWIGLGRMYAVGAGIAFISGVAAVDVVTEMPVEWAPATFIAAAFVMVMTDLAGDERLTRRIGETWTWMGQGLALLAIGGAVAVAPLAYDADETYIETTRWFLPLTFVLFAAAASVPALLTKRDHFVVASIAAIGSAGVTVAYATDMPAEGWVITFAATAVGMAALLAVAERAEQMLPPLTVGALLTAANASVIGAATVTAISLLAELDSSYEVTWRWFIVAGGVLVVAAYALIAATRTGRRPGESLTAAIGGVASAGAAALGVVYARDLPAEWYAIAATAFAAALGVAMLVAGDQRVRRYSPARLGDVMFVAGGLAVVVAAATTSGVMSALLRDTDPYDVQQDWFVAIAGALGLAFFVLASCARRGGASRAEGTLISSGAIAMLTAGVLGALFALERPAEMYAIAIGCLAPAVAVIGLALRDRTLARFSPAAFGDTAFAAGSIATVVVGLMAVSIALRAQMEGEPFASYDLSTRWFALAALAPCAAFFAIDAYGWRRQASALGLVPAVMFSSIAFVYGLDASAEFYSFAILLPAIAGAAVVRWAPASIDGAIGASWRDHATLLTRGIGALGVAYALLLVNLDADGDWTPHLPMFLAMTFALAAVLSAVDASRRPGVGTSAALVASIIATVVSVPYGLYAGPAWYGVALAGAGVGMALAGRVYTPAWVDARTRDVLSALAVGTATLPFEAAYADRPAAGAGVHMAAAAFFAGAAVRTQSRERRLLDLHGIPLSMGWLYAAGAAATVGYIFALRATAGDEGAESGTIAIPMMTVSAALLVAGVATRFARPDFRLHLYAMSLLAALVSLAAAPDELTLAWMLTAYIVAWTVVAALENEPAIALPAAALGFLAVAAWRAHADASYALLPMAYAAIAAGAYATALAVRTTRPAWSVALRATGATYAFVAPAAGFIALAYLADGPLLYGEPFEQSALYQWSTAAVAVAGLVALVESSIARRRWVVVPGSAVLLIALLLQIGRYHPDDFQPYTAAIGAYLVLLGSVGLARMRLLGRGEDFAPYVEALGAATIMLPSFVQSLGAEGWPYTLLLLVEATAFFSAGVTLRRRGLLAAAITFLVLVSGRTLFDAINAMPNWMVVALVGIGLLGVGVGILLGRERWERWQRAMLSWWQEADGHPAAP